MLVDLFLLYTYYIEEHFYNFKRRFFMKRKLLLIALLVVVAGCSEKNTLPAHAEGDSFSLVATRSYRAKLFQEYVEADLPQPEEPLCVALHTAAGWHDALFDKRTGVYAVESLRESLNSKGFTSDAIAHEIKRRNQAFVYSLSHHARRNEPLPQCRIDPFDHITIILGADGVQGVMIPRDIQLLIAKLGRVDENWIKNLDNNDVLTRESAFRRFSYYTALFRLSDHDLRAIGVGDNDIAALRGLSSSK